MPEAGWNGWYSDWWNFGEGGGHGMGTTFHTMPAPACWRATGGRASNRVVAGLSMGGHGALMYAARHRGMFKAAAAYSGAAHPLLNDESVNRIMGFFAGRATTRAASGATRSTSAPSGQGYDPYYLARGLKSLPVYLSGDGSTGLGSPGQVFGDQVALTWGDGLG